MWALCIGLCNRHCTGSLSFPAIVCLFVDWAHFHSCPHLPLFYPSSQCLFIRHNSTFHGIACAFLTGNTGKLDSITLRFSHFLCETCNHIHQSVCAHVHILAQDQQLPLDTVSSSARAFCKIGIRKHPFTKNGTEIKAHPERLR